MKREFLYLEPGKTNPRTMVEGQKRERAKAERPAEAHERYLVMLKQRKEALEQEQPVSEGKKPRVLRPTFPVRNPQSPVIQARE